MRPPRAVAVASLFFMTSVLPARAEDPPRGGSYCDIWKLSFSPLNPYQNTAPPSPSATVYLWVLWPWLGVTAAEFAVSVPSETGEVVVASFEPMNGFLNSGTATELRLSTNCQGFNLPVLAGRFTVLDAVGGGTPQGFRMCLGPSHEHGLNVTTDCAGFTHLNSGNGATTDGTEPCEYYGDYCGGIAVEPSRWGSIKSYYR